MRYTGAFRAVELDGAALLGSPVEASAGLGVRAATVLSLVDMDLTWRSRWGGPTAVHHLVAATRIHPLGLALFHESAWVDLLASLYLRAGVGAQAGAGWGGVWTLGAGVDWPLHDPDQGHGPWLGLRYSHFFPFGPVHGFEAQHRALVGVALAYRLNGL